MYRFLILFFITLNSCNSSETKHEDLISFKSQFQRDLTLAEMENGGEVKKVIKETIHQDTLEVQVDFKQSGYMNFDGNIRLKNDTLFLEYWPTHEEVCDEWVVYRLEYLIHKHQDFSYKTILFRNEE